jgi:hypothetical protein
MPKLALVASRRHWVAREFSPAGAQRALERPLQSASLAHSRVHPPHRQADAAPHCASLSQATSQFELLPACGAPLGSLHENRTNASASEAHGPSRRNQQREEYDSSARIMFHSPSGNVEH